MDILNEHGIFQRLMMAATRLEANANRYYFEPLGLTTTYCRIICILASQDKSTPTEILRRIGGTKSNVSQRLDVMEKNGWAKRTDPQAGDKRNIHVELTAAGRKKYEDIKVLMAQRSAHLENILTPEEKRHAHIILDKLNAIMDGHDERLREENGTKNHLTRGKSE